ncbi:MAG: zinc-binding dehydrogenase [Verrucomicrobia bacterium]|nr:zinc-binding dehydrogenase [Verrucomicrobiota bacterium]
MIIPQTMQAVRLHGVGFENLKVEQVRVPVPNDNQLLARVDAAGVCASNLKIIAQGNEHTFINGMDLKKYPAQLGDEGCITIVTAGRNVCDRFPVGKRYCIQPAVNHPPINHRDRFRDSAKGMQKMAVGYSLPGHFAQYILVTEETIAADCLLPVPDETMPFYAAALCEPISCAISGQDRHIHVFQKSPSSPREPRLGLLPGGVTLIVGAGPMGRMHAEAALRFKPRCIIVLDISESRLQWVRDVLSVRAKSAGIDIHALTNGAGLELMKKVTGGLGADDIIVAVGVRALQIQAQAWLARGGTLNLFGGLKKGEHVIDLDTLRVHYDDIRVVGSSGGSPADIAETLRMVAAGEFDPGLHMTMVGSLDQAPKALEMVKNTETDGKIVLYPHIRPTPLEPAKGWKLGDEQSFLKRLETSRFGVGGC